MSLQGASQNLSEVNDTNESAPKKVYVVDDNYDDDLVVSDNIVKEVSKGSLYFFVFSDKKRVYTYDPVLDSKIIKVAEGLNSIVDIAVDMERKYLFVADFDEFENKTVVYKYHVFVNFTDINNLKIFTRLNATYLVYEGDIVSGIAVDHITHTLFIADTTKKQIIKISFANETNPLGEAMILYHSLP